MAISFTRPDPSSPSSVASASFTTARKGFEPSEVREFLRMVAAELARLQERERFLERELRTAQRNTAPSSVALDEELVTKMLGEEAARILHTSRDAASQIKSRAEEGAARLLREATDEAQRLREEAEIESARRRADATADAEAELEMAKQQGRDMVNEARAYRERVLNELARRREIARQQIEQLVHGRDRLLQAFERSRLVAVDVMAELTPLGEPSEYVNLSPTTGPVPLMVPNMPRPGSAAVAPSAERSIAPAPPAGLAGPADDADPTVALSASPVVPLVETERAATPSEARADRTSTAAAPEPSPASVDAGPVTIEAEVDEQADDETVTIFVDDEVEAERAAERARHDDALERQVPARPEVVESSTDAEVTAALDARARTGSDDPTADTTGDTSEDATDDTVVVLGISPTVDDDEHDHDDRVPAPVVNLFGTSSDRAAARAADADRRLDAAADADDVDTDDEPGLEFEPDDPEMDAVEIDAIEVDELLAVVDADSRDDLDDVVELDDAVDLDESENAPEASRSTPKIEVEAEVAPEAPAADPDATVALSRTSADDLFARLRAARAETVAQRAAAHTAPAAPASRPADEATAVDPKAVESKAVEPKGEKRTPGREPAAPAVTVTPPTPTRAAVTSEPAVFQRTASAPVPTADPADTPFARRDEVLTPLILQAARKLKRVLADEQNEVLHALRRKEPVRDVDAMLAAEAAQGERYAGSISVELSAAAVAGATSMGADASTAARAVERERATDGAASLLVSEIVLPLRARLARCVADADGDNGELASMVRLVYREWKNQRIDEHLDDVTRTAFGRGALVGVAPGTRICWLVDPNGPECPDAEDNALAGAVPAGEGFPTDHPCAPAHSGCRCMIARAD